MPTIYLKHEEEKGVMKLRGPNPQVTDWMRTNGWVRVDKLEFRRVKAKIRKNKGEKLITTIQGLA